MQYDLTHHAEARAQQRGLPPYMLDFLMSYGTEVAVLGGGTKYIFDGQATRRFERELGRDHLMVQVIERLKKAFVIVATDGAVITAGWRTKPTRRKWNSWGKSQRHERARKQNR